MSAAASGGSRHAVPETWKQRVGATVPSALQLCALTVFWIFSPRRVNQNVGLFASAFFPTVIGPSVFSACTDVSCCFL